jgi:alpha-ketoglutarate-dependent taurine dioxygenase
MKFTPLHPSLGALVEGVDCNDDFCEQADRLKTALAQWQLLLFRGQDLADPAFLEFCRNFGTLELLPEPEKRHPEFPEIFNLSNVKPNGSLTHRDDPQAVFLRGTSRWHTAAVFAIYPV